MILIVGEAPGRKEIEQGECFVGPAGQYLRLVLSEYDIDFEFTNVIKYLPTTRGQLRGLNKLEIVNNQERILGEIKSGKYEAVITLGASALMCALDVHAKLKHHKGTWTWIGPCPVFHTIHPSYARRFNLKEEMEAHIAKFMYYLNIKGKSS